MNEVNKYIQTVNISAIGIRTITSNVWSVPIVQSQLKHLSVQDLQVLTLNVHRYILAFHHDIAGQVFDSASAAQVVIQEQSRTRRALGNDAPFPGIEFTWRATKYLLAGVAIWLLWRVKFWKWIKPMSIFKALTNKLTSLWAGPAKEVGPRAIIPFAPTFSAHLEEWIKCIPGAAHVVGFLDAMVHGDWRKYTYHVKSMKDPFDVRLRDHLLYNRGGLYAEYCDYVEKMGPVVFTPGVEVLAPGTRLPSAQVPFIPPEKAWTWASSQKPGYNPESKEYPGWYPICWGLSPMVKPAASCVNLKAAWHFRIRAVDNSEVYGPFLKQLKGFAKHLGFEYRDDFQKWWLKQSSKQKRQLQTEILESELMPTRDRAGTFVKSNELVGSEKKMIPRIVINVTKQFQLSLGPFTSELSSWCKEVLFPMREPRKLGVINGYTIYAGFAYGVQSDSLDSFVRFANATQGQAIFLMCLGDDTWFATRKNDLKMGESDFSKFDRSIGFDLLELFFEFVEHLGYPLFAAEYRRMYAKEPSYQHRGTGVRFDKEDLERWWYRFTGEPATCLANSLLNIWISAFALAYEDVLVYSLAGLTVKHCVPSSGHVTFLKGVFLTNLKGELQWLRLPSCFVKYGKILETDPLNQFPVSVPVQTRYRRCLKANWLSYGFMGAVWVYRRFDKWIKQLCPEEVEPDKLEEWQIKTSFGETIADEVFNDFCSQRYGIEPGDWEKFFEKLESIDLFPVLISDPVYQRLSIDYN